MLAAEPGTFEQLGAVHFIEFFFDVWLEACRDYLLKHCADIASDTRKVQCDFRVPHFPEKCQLFPCGKDSLLKPVVELKILKELEPFRVPLGWTEPVLAKCN